MATLFAGAVEMVCRLSRTIHTQSLANLAETVAFPSRYLWPTPDSDPTEFEVRVKGLCLCLTQPCPTPHCATGTCLPPITSVAGELGLAFQLWQRKTQEHFEFSSLYYWSKCWWETKDSMFKSMGGIRPTWVWRLNHPKIISLTCWARIKVTSLGIPHNKKSIYKSILLSFPCREPVWICISSQLVFMHKMFLMQSSSFCSLCAPKAPAQGWQGKALVQRNLGLLWNVTFMKHQFPLFKISLGNPLSPCLLKCWKWAGSWYPFAVAVPQTLLPSLLCTWVWNVQGCSAAHSNCFL